MNETTKKPCCPGKVDQLIKANRFTEANRDWLNSLTEEQINPLVDLSDKLEAAGASSLATNKASEKASDKEITVDQALAVLAKQKPTAEQFMGILPAETREFINSGLKAQQDKRAQMITMIMAATKESKVYSEDELKAMPMKDLEKLFAFIPEPAADFSGYGAGSDSTNTEEILLPTGYAEEEKKEGGK